MRRRILGLVGGVVKGNNVSFENVRFVVSQIPRHALVDCQFSASADMLPSDGKYG